LWLKSVGADKMITAGGGKITVEDPAFVQGGLSQLWREISLGVYVLDGYYVAMISQS